MQAKRLVLNKAGLISLTVTPNAAFRKARRIQPASHCVGRDLIPTTEREPWATLICGMETATFMNLGVSVDYFSVATQVVLWLARA